jgi:DNA modification methylase
LKTAKCIVLSPEFRNRTWACDSYEALIKHPDNSVDLMIMSPPYLWVRDYEMEGQYGLEYWFDCVPLILKGTMSGYCGSCYMCHMHKVLAECYRILKPTGVLYLNVGDTMYTAGFGKDDDIETTKQGTNSGTIEGRDHLRETRKEAMKKKWYKQQCFCLIPERFIQMMVDRIGFICRGKPIWEKTNGFPAPWKNRPTLNYEFVYQFVKKSPGYYYNRELTREPLAEATIERMKYMEYGFNQLKGGVNSRHTENKPFRFTPDFQAAAESQIVESKSPFGVFGGNKHAGRNGNKIYSGNEYKPHDGRKNPGSVWHIPTKTFGKEFCTNCDVLRPRKQLAFRCKDCNTEYKKMSPSELAIAAGLDPEAICSVCQRSIKRHFSPNTKSRVKGIYNVGILCETGKKIEVPDVLAGCPKCKSQKREIICRVCKVPVHCHFAMYPEELVERCIKAACPPKCCAECGVPYFPKIKPSAEYAQKLGKGFHAHTEDTTAGMMQHKQTKAADAEYIIEGYIKGCKCETEETVAPVVCDPFSGWDTTGAVAKILAYKMPEVWPNGIDNIAIDIDPKNIRAGEQRIEDIHLSAKAKSVKEKIKIEKITSAA